MSTVRHLSNLRLYKHLYELNILRPLTGSSKLLTSIKKTNIGLHHNHSFYKHIHSFGAHQLICVQGSDICQHGKCKPCALGSCGNQFIHTSQTVLEEEEEKNNIKDNGDEPADEAEKEEPRKRTKKFVIIDFETSIRYLKSEAYKKTYEDQPVWLVYRRNFKGQFAPKKTRPSCVLKGYRISGNPCPICRDEYLVVDYRNVDLLRQFVSPHTDKVLATSWTNVCQKQHRNIEVAVENARLHGLLPFYVPFRWYNYRDYYTFVNKEKDQ